MSYGRFVALALLVLSAAPSAFAQQPFSLALTAPDREPAARRTDSATLLAGAHFNPLFGGITTSGRVTWLALEDARFDRRDSRAVRQSEFLISLFDHSPTVRLAVGGGIRSEGAGGNVLMTRVAAEKRALGGRLIGNALFERRMAGARDTVDLITTVGWSRRVTPRLRVGVETLAEDLEGLWSANEAEGGSRLFVGPSIDVGPSSRSWTVHVTAGAAVQGTGTARTSGGLRALGRPGFVMRVSTTRHF